MEFQVMLPILVSVLVLLLVVGGAAAVNIVLRLRAGERVNFPTRLLFRLYLYLVTLISVFILVVGLADLVQAGLGAALGKEFSYTPVHVGVAPARPAIEGEAKGQETQEPTEEELKIQQEWGLDRAMKEGLLNGASLSGVGAVVLALHTWGRRRLERAEERQDVVRRGFVILVLVVFGVVTLVSLPVAVYDTLRYYILEPVDDFSRGAHPGAGLATAIVAAPVWAYGVGATLKLLWRQEDGAVDSA